MRTSGTPVVRRIQHIVQYTQYVCSKTYDNRTLRFHQQHYSFFKVYTALLLVLIKNEVVIVCEVAALCRFPSRKYHAKSTPRLYDNIDDLQDGCTPL